MLVVETHDQDLDDDGGLCAGSIPKYCLQYSPIPVTIVLAGMGQDGKQG